MNWRIAIIPATLIPIIIIIIQFDIKLDDVLAICVVPFILSVFAMMIKLGLQGVKLAYIARTFLGPFDSIKRLTAMRVGSEFIKFTTPMFVGAEFAVIYYMKKKRLPNEIEIVHNATLGRRADLEPFVDRRDSFSGFETKF